MFTIRASDRRENSKYAFYFGSAHASGLNMAFSDGSVHWVDFEIDGKVWSRYGGRDDEQKER